MEYILVDLFCFKKKITRAYFLKPRTLGKKKVKSMPSVSCQSSWHCWVNMEEVVWREDATMKRSKGMSKEKYCLLNKHIRRDHPCEDRASTRPLAKPKLFMLSSPSSLGTLQLHFSSPIHCQFESLPNIPGIKFEGFCTMPITKNNSESQEKTIILNKWVEVE